MSNERILILDCGSQLTSLIARRTREVTQTYCEIHPWFKTAAELEAAGPWRGVIISGSGDSVRSGTIQIADEIYSWGIPVLGICYGLHLICEKFGGIIESSSIREFGHTRVTVTSRQSELFRNVILDENFSTVVWMSHGDSVNVLPNGFEVTAKSDTCPVAAFENREKYIFGVQFHPEVTHTAQGATLLKNFVSTICGCVGKWSVSGFYQTAEQNVSRVIGADTTGRVLLGLSGGVDSMVAAAVLNKLVGDRLVAVFVNNGLLRENEAEEVNLLMKTQLSNTEFIYVDASERFLQKLKGVTDPETKRKIIGAEFIDVFQEKASCLQNIRYLGQGTIYPDVIESAGVGTAETIKSHHNVGGLSDRLSLVVVEPLRNLFKDEVRQLGLQMGLPKFTIMRHPFPGPGLAIRMIGEVKPEYLIILRKADAIFRAELLNNIRSTKPDGTVETFSDYVSQPAVIFLPVRSVGVQGDARSYEFAVVLRAVVTSDFMTGEVADLPTSLLTKISTRIINEVKGINRVTYDISTKPPATIEWE